ncbi:hypothetical protein GQ43DRAFT_163946 [Delitschia confertaspora ATCC 74209]|uniref:Uncharacterized protein n=1 Tax=Delitschia confertaspora ATCC 74209 TaxID=1513339 RepID=A0A9P4MSU1_9PLEO|nr:hypothetical protein GQ43DRAFT_163946 [Delitschia confertaspora ATCC 74209]
MCWINFSPTKKARPPPSHVHSSSSIEEIVRIKPRRRRRARIIAPSVTVCSEPSSISHDDHHNHFHPPHYPVYPHHLQPSHHIDHHWHPLRLHGHGVKIAHPLPPPPPPPSPCPEKDREVRIQFSHETRTARISSEPQPRYRTVIATPISVGRPTTSEVIRASTREALREVKVHSGSKGGRLRRVAGYEILSTQVPWSWDCVSSGGENGQKWKPRTRTSHPKYPPFGSPGRWIK